VLAHRAPVTLGESAYRRLTPAAIAALPGPHTGLVPVPISTSNRTTEDTPAGEIPPVRCSHGGNVARWQRGGIMDNVERSFAVATAAGFVVLVIGIILLALI